jgi:hypothetical protein
MRRLQRHWILAGDSARPAGSKDISAVVQGLRRKGTRHTSSGEKGAPAQLVVFSQVDHVRLAPESDSEADMPISTQWAKKRLIHRSKPRGFSRSLHWRGRGVLAVTHNASWFATTR